MQDCRNCGSSKLKELGFVGEVAPFFLKRVLNLEVRTSQARHPLRLLARRLCALPQRFFAKVYGSSVYAEMQICTDCSFVQAKHAFADDALGRLYADYRSVTYNEERIRYEPTYAALAKHVGVSEQEIETRVGGLTAWLGDKIDVSEDFSMLDFGGSDGRFLPRLAGEKYVFEISDTSPIEGVSRIAKEADLATYSYAQLAHVLEHVSEPLALVKHVASFIKPNGYLYIEVPQELTDAELAELKIGTAKRGLTIHEHINVFCRSSVTRLVEAAGLDLISAESTKVDMGWTTSINVRALCKNHT
jgi:SAM-dependent methyltransferase